MRNSKSPTSERIKFDNLYDRRDNRDIKSCNRGLEQEWYHSAKLIQVNKYNDWEK